MPKFKFDLVVELEAVNYQEASLQIAKYCDTANEFSHNHPMIDIHFTCPQIEGGGKTMGEIVDPWRRRNIKNMN